MEDHLSTQQVTLWHAAFNSFDYHSTGNIALVDLQDLLKAIGQSYNEASLAKYGQEVCNKSDTGRINFSECLCIIRGIIKDNAEEENDRRELKEAFKVYDKEGKGHIRASDFREILTNLDDSQTEEELDDLITEFDTDGSGTIDLDEFLNAMAKK